MSGPGLARISRTSPIGPAKPGYRFTRSNRTRTCADGRPRRRARGDWQSICGARAERLPYGDDTFDAAVAGLVFCTIPDPEAALDELARVLRPGGEVRFLEHVQAEGFRGRLQPLVEPLWKPLAGGVTPLGSRSGRSRHPRRSRCARSSGSASGSPPPNRSSERRSCAAGTAGSPSGARRERSVSVRVRRGTAEWTDAPTLGCPAAPTAQRRSHQ